MSSFPTSPIDTDALMSRIRTEATQRKQQATHAVDAGPSETIKPVVLAALPLSNAPKPKLPDSDRFHLDDFLALHDADFIDAAYRGILARRADAGGRGHFLTSLRNGSLGKIEILGRLRYSAEGRRRGVAVRGLLPAFAVQSAFRVPVLGGVAAFLVALLRLPRFARTLQGFENYQHYRNAENEAMASGLARTVESNERLLADDIARRAGTSSQRWQHVQSALAQWQVRDADRDRWASDVADRIANSEQRLQSLSARIAESEGRLAAADTRLADTDARFAARMNTHEARIALVESHRPSIDRQLADTIELAQKTSVQLAATVHDALASLDKRIDTLDGTLRSEQSGSRSAHLRLIERLARVEGRVHEQGLRAAGDAPSVREVSPRDDTAPVDSAASTRFERLYFAFEHRFRGSREDIRRRLSYYLPLLRESVVGTQGARVLDIGCGRGEWLELLRDESISASGIDINEAMAAECAEHGVKVEVGDAIAHLKRLPDNALGALTGFHIIEHIPLEVLLELIDEAHRVVQPGGLVIFETPNPENLAVGACSFYTDPTHKRPLPPVLTQFLVEAGGFTDVAIHRVNANLLPKLFDEPAESDPPALRGALAWLRGAFSCAPDYSVVGRVA